MVRRFNRMSGSTDFVRLAVAAVTGGLILILGGSVFAQESGSGVVRVQVTGPNDRPEAGLSVTLERVRPRGPFSAKKLKSLETWSQTTNADGVAKFRQIPRRGRAPVALIARTVYQGTPFQTSVTRVQSQKTKLELKVGEVASRASAIEVDQLDTVVQIWEDYVVFTQVWNIGVEGNQPVDTSLLSGDEYKNGLPIKVPMEAEGIRAQSTGSTNVTNNVVFWNGTIGPNRARRVRLRYSISANSSEFVYEQKVDYPVEKLRVIAPVSTGFSKLPRLDALKLAAPGFDNVRAVQGIRGLRPGRDYLVAEKEGLEADQTFVFQLQGLPFGRSWVPWTALGAGVLGAIFVFFLGFYRKRFRLPNPDETTPAEMREHLETMRGECLERIEALEDAYRNDEVSQVEYEKRLAGLKKRLSRVVSKLNEHDTDGSD